jgi:hypothetical protein
MRTTSDNIDESPSERWGVLRIAAVPVRQDDACMPRLVVGLAVVGLLVATPLATWWNVGPLDFTHRQGGNTTVVLIHPPDVSEGTEATLGRTATGLVVVSWTALGVATACGLFDRSRWLMLTPLVLLGAFCGAGWRVLTATTEAWDLGITLAAIFVGIPFGIFVVVVLVVWAIVAYR